MALAAVPLPFLRSSLITIIKLTAIPKLTALTQFFLRWLNDFKKWCIRPSPLPPYSYRIAALLR